MGMGVDLTARQRRGRAGISIDQERTERKKLREIIPSEAWLDASFTSIDDTDPQGNPITVQILSRAFPPGGANTSMVQCPICGRTVPPNDIETWTEERQWRGQRLQVEISGCTDHKESLSLIDYTPSPSAEAIRELRERHLRLPTTNLPPESLSRLRSEIARYEKTGKLRHKRRNVPR